MSQEEMRRVVVVGAGHGGGTAAAVLRQQGFAGEVVLIGDEPVGPYHRPPLSKSLLKGDLEQPLQPEAFYADQRIDLRTDTIVTAIDIEARTVTLADGDDLAFDALILATGAKARQLSIPGMDLDHVYELRTIVHARVLADVLATGSRLAIVGGGWIGLEVAASARSAGIEVTVIEREERLLARVASPELSAHLTAYHEAQGTGLIVGSTVTALEAGEAGAVGAIRLADGRAVTCDRVLVGVGAVAQDDLARAAGLPCEDGVVVDACAATGTPGVYAVGDVTRRPLHLHDGLFRLESIPSAVEQARQAVAGILGKPVPAAEVPWFWSDQFDLKLQIAGLIAGADTTVVRQGADHGRYVVFHLRDRRLIAVEAVNGAAEFMAGKHLIRDEVELDIERLADSTVRLDDVVASGAAPAARVAEPDAEPGVAETPAMGDGPTVGETSGKPGEPRVTYIQHDGEVQAVDVPAGLTVMDGSVRNNLPGIIAECGGMCSCGTCHIFVDAAWADKLPEAEYEEADLLEFLEGRQDTSRLSCQLVVTDELDGLVVRVPKFEG